MHAASDPLRVCLVSAAYLPYPSGVSEHVAHLAAALVQLGHHVEVLTTRFHLPDATDSLDAADGIEHSSGVTVHRAGRAILLPANGSYATLPVGLSMPAQVRRVLRQGHFDIVHCHGFAFPEIAYWAIRYSDSVNVVSLLAAGFTQRRTGGRLFRTVFRRHLARIHAVIALSQWAAACHEAFVPGPYTIVPSGIDLERFRPGLPPLPTVDVLLNVEAKRSAQLEAPPTAPRRPPTVLFVGRLDARKGLDVLLHAFARVHAAVPSARLVVVGAGPGESAARRHIEHLGLAACVVFAGRVSRNELPRFYAGARVFVSPALGGESFGIVLLEAMASGTPVIASNIAGYDEVVRAGIDGLLVPPGDAHALSAAIIRVLHDDNVAAQFAGAGRSRAADFAWETVARRTVAVYAGARDAQTRSRTSP